MSDVAWEQAAERAPGEPQSVFCPFLREFLLRWDGGGAGYGGSRALSGYRARGPGHPVYNGTSGNSMKLQHNAGPAIAGLSSPFKIQEKISLLIQQVQ